MLCLFAHMPDYADCGKGILYHSLYLLFVDMLLISPSMQEQIGCGGEIECQAL